MFLLDERPKTSYNVQALQKGPRSEERSFGERRSEALKWNFFSKRKVEQRASLRRGPVAQLGERVVRIHEVRGFDPLQVHHNNPTVIWLWGFVLIWRSWGGLLIAEVVRWTTFALHHPRGSRGEPHSISFLLHRRLRFSVRRHPTVLHHLLPP